MREQASIVEAFLATRKSLETDIVAQTSGSRRSGVGLATAVVTSFFERPADEKKIACMEKREPWRTTPGERTT